MTCRHSDPINNPACSSYETPEEQLANLEKQKESVKAKFKLTDTPDSERFEIEDFAEIGEYFVVKASYPNCKNCSYEGVKVMVFQGVGVRDALKWRKIDPHFRETTPLTRAEAPGPIARFPASKEGWLDALSYAANKAGPRTK